MKKPVNSRAKGASAERELSALVHEHLGIKLVRNLEQSRGGGHDLIPSGDNAIVDYMHGLAIECKRYATVTPALMDVFWRQTGRQAEMCGKTPVLIYRADRREWRVVIPLSMIDKEVFSPEWPGNSLAWTAEITVEAFCALVREKSVGCRA